MLKLVIVALLLGLIAIFIPHALAQDGGLDSATFTEAFINAQLQARQKPDAKVTGLSADLRPGQIVVSGSVQTRQGAVAFALTLVPEVSGGRVVMNPTSITLGGAVVDLSRFAQAADTSAIDHLQALANDAARNHRVESVTVTDTTITITWQRQNPDAPALTIMDNVVTLTVTEDYFNALPGVTHPRDPRLSAMHVDFQPGQLTITANRTELNGTPQAISVTLVPVLNSGTVTWSVKAMSVAGAAEDSTSVGQMNDDIAGSWRLFFTGVYHPGQLSNLVMTDTTLALTWDGSLNNTLIEQMGTGGLVITEDFINQSFRVTHPQAYTITGVHVDLQPGQAVVSANLNLSSGKVLAEQVTFVPDVSNGVLFWTVSAATLDGQALDPAIIARYNEAVTTFWASALWSQVSDYAVTGVTITDSEIDVAIARR